jgi:hypothetical protein
MNAKQNAARTTIAPNAKVPSPHHIAGRDRDVLSLWEAGQLSMMAACELLRIPGVRRGAVGLRQPARAQRRQNAGSESQRSRLRSRLRIGVKRGREIITHECRSALLAA